MSRFGNLEFGQEITGDFLEPKVEKDEAYYFADAATAFEDAAFERALRSYSKVLEFNARNAAAWAGQVRALIELGEFREAKLWADKALERFPHEAELLAAKAVALGRCGDVDGALAFSDAAIEEHGDTPYIWLARADVLLAREDRRADWCLNKALTLAGDNWFIAWLAARIRYFHHQFALALRHVQQALAARSDHSVLWLLQGQCQQQLGMVGAARLSLTQALELKPDCDLAKQALVTLERTSWLGRIAGWLKGLSQR